MSEDDHVYIAGALFTPAQRKRLEEIDEICKECGKTTYLPHRDGGLFDRGEANPEDFFTSDRDAIDESDVIVAMLNGPPFDSGTVWEIGYGYSEGVDLIGIIEDERVFDIPNQVNPMLVASLDKILRSIEMLHSEFEENL